MPTITCDVPATALASRFFSEVVNEQNFDLLEEILAEGFISHNFPLPYSGGFAFGEGVRALCGGFPDLRVMVEDQSSADGKVFHRGWWTGTHRGYFQGIPATGRRVKVSFMDAWCANDGRLAENWLLMDEVGLMLQLGAIPSPAAGN